MRFPERIRLTYTGLWLFVLAANLGLSNFVLKKIRTDDDAALFFDSFRCANTQVSPYEAFVFNPLIDDGMADLVHFMNESETAPVGEKLEVTVPVKVGNEVSKINLFIVKQHDPKEPGFNPYLFVDSWVVHPNTKIGVGTIGTLSSIGFSAAQSEEYLNFTRDNRIPIDTDYKLVWMNYNSDGFFHLMDGTDTLKDKLVCDQNDFLIAHKDRMMYVNADDKEYSGIVEKGQRFPIVFSLLHPDYLRIEQFLTQYDSNQEPDQQVHKRTGFLDLTTGKYGVSRPADYRILVLNDDNELQVPWPQADTDGIGLVRIKLSDGSVHRLVYAKSGQNAAEIFVPVESQEVIAAASYGTNGLVLQLAEGSRIDRIEFILINNDPYASNRPVQEVYNELLLTSD
jgi:hypothetical protein